MQVIYLQLVIVWLFEKYAASINSETIDFGIGQGFGYFGFHRSWIAVYQKSSSYA
jgi:hypothetical protein